MGQKIAMLLQDSSSNKSRQIIVFLAVTLLLLAVNILAEGNEKETCTRRRLWKEVTYPNCGSVWTKVNYCTGSCFSYLVQIPTPSYLLQDFRCCAATHMQVKIRRLLFPNCTDSDTPLTQKAVFFPYFRNCSCLDPRSPLLFS